MIISAGLIPVERGSAGYEITYDTMSANGSIITVIA
jgi:hypothetical protein